MKKVTKKEISQLKKIAIKNDKEAQLILKSFGVTLKESKKQLWGDLTCNQYWNKLEKEGKLLSTYFKLLKIPTDKELDIEFHDFGQQTYKWRQVNFPIFELTVFEKDMKEKMGE